MIAILLAILLTIMFIAIPVTMVASSRHNRRLENFALSVAGFCIVAAFITMVWTVALGVEA